MFTRTAPALEHLFMTMCIEYKHCRYGRRKLDSSKILLKLTSMLADNIFSRTLENKTYYNHTVLYEYSV